MKNCGVLFLSILFVLSFSDVMYAQTDQTEKTDKEILEEYEQWSAMKDDWPNLNRYRQANLELGQPGTGEQRVVFMGNSITEGWSDHYPEFFEGKPYINRGIGGQTTPQMLVRFRQDVIHLQPDIVVILAGTNDIAGNTGPATLDMIADNLFSMADLADAHGMRVILSSVLPVYDYPWRPGLEPARKIMDLNRMIRSFTEEKGFYYLDYFTSTADERNGMKEHLAYDGVHPNREGYILMSKLADEAIKTVLESQP